MTATHNPIQKHRDALFALLRERQNAPDRLGRLRKALLSCASETPDNVKCAKRLSINDAGQLCIGTSSISLSDVANALEESATPRAVLDSCPNITAEDWSAFTRLTTLIYVLMEPPPPAAER